VVVFLAPLVRLAIHAFCNVALCPLLGNSVAWKDRSAFEMSVLYTIQRVWRCKNVWKFNDTDL